MCTVLVVDDSTTVRQLLKLGLARIPGMVCEDAQDGSEALSKLAARKFDLVFCDINMPVLDGLAFLGELKKQPDHPPVVMVTTEGAQDDQKRAMELGAAYYLTKPVQLPQVLEVARRFLPQEPAPQKGKA